MSPENVMALASEIIEHGWPLHPQVLYNRGDDTYCIAEPPEWDDTTKVRRWAEALVLAASYACDVLFVTDAVMNAGGPKPSEDPAATNAIMVARFTVAEADAWMRRYDVGDDGTVTFHDPEHLEPMQGWQVDMYHLAISHRDVLPVAEAVRGLEGYGWVVSR